jgi:hypothetical protein
MIAMPHTWGQWGKIAGKNTAVFSTLEELCLAGNLVAGKNHDLAHYSG